MIIQPVVPMPPYGLKVNITSVPEAWLRLSDRAQWDAAVEKLLERIGMICQQHIRQIMRGQEPGADGKTVQFMKATGHGVQAIEYEVKGNAVEIFANDRAKYLVYQEHGVSTQPMRWLIGKTIPWTLIQGARINPKTGNNVFGVTRVVYAGEGTRYQSPSVGGTSAETKKLTGTHSQRMQKIRKGSTYEEGSLNGEVGFSTITEATFTRPSRFNPTGYKFWHPGYPGKGFFRDGMRAGLVEAADHVNGLSFQVTGGSPEPDLGTDLTGPDTHFVQEYQNMLDGLEERMIEAGEL